MKPSECPHCGGGPLQHGRLPGGGIRYRFWRCAPVTAAACLNCGVVTTYLDDWTLEQVRKSNGLGEKVKGGPSDDL